MMSRAVNVPVIGIGAGRYCDGQVLVFHDMLGLFDRFTPRFVKQYRQVGKEIVEAFVEFKSDIKSGCFPSEEHAFAGFSSEDADSILVEIQSRRTF